MDLYLVLPFVNAVMLDDDGWVLVGEHPHREGKPYPGFTDIPGGKLEPDETPAQGILREIGEETGLEVFSLQLLGVYHHSRNVFLPDCTSPVPGICMCYLVLGCEGKLVSTELTNLRWISVGEALALNLTPWARYFLEGL